MILQALTRLFEDLAQQGKIARPGWSPAKISYALCLSEDGQLEYVVPMFTKITVGKKTQQRPTPKELPSPVTRTVGILPNFLWDNSSYLLGVDEKGKPERSRNCFRACAELHHRLLDDVDSPAARAILSFFDTWQPENAREHPALADCWEGVVGGNLIFRVGGMFAQEDPLIRSAWDASYADVQGEKQQCLVTGNWDVPEPVHPAVKGVAGAQSSGAAIVSFNAPAFCSYGKEQSLNAPVGKYAAFAYTAALNYLLGDKPNVHRIGDTTVVCWAEGAQPQYSLFAGLSLFGDDLPEGLTDNDLRSALENLSQGLPCEELNLDPSRPFYILGLAPNAARLSVRFFCRNSFGALMKNVNEHHKRMEIVGRRCYVTPLWAMLRETVRKPEPGQKWPDPNPVMSAAAIRAICTNTGYPASLLILTLQGIRAERDVTPTQAAILKAYLQSLDKDGREGSTDRAIIQEVANVKLNRDCCDTPYLLGRLFAVLEEIQSASSGWQLSHTIRRSYFVSVTNSTGAILRQILQLSEFHMNKLSRDKPNLAKKLEDEKADILCRITDEIPRGLTAEETTRFYLGYYHQKHQKEDNQYERHWESV